MKIEKLWLNFRVIHWELSIYGINNIKGNFLVRIDRFGEKIVFMSYDDIMMIFSYDWNSLFVICENRNWITSVFLNYFILT